MKVCPFCSPGADRVFHEGELILGLWDAFPVSPRHALVVTRRHIKNWFEASPEEQQALLEGSVLRTTDRDAGFSLRGGVRDRTRSLSFDFRELNVVLGFTAELQQRLQ